LGIAWVALYWGYSREINWLHGVVFVDLIVVGTAFGQMALAAALLHDTIIAANPFTVLIAILRVGWAYVIPCLVASVALVLGGLGVYGLLFRMPRMWMEAVALWAFWVFVLYERGDGCHANAGADLSRSCGGAGLVPSPATVGDLAVARADLQQLVRNRAACLAFDGASV
jgi:hypothetical protein